MHLRGLAVLLQGWGHALGAEPKIAHGRAVDRTNDGHTVHGERQHDRPVPVAALEVRRAVDRVHDPAARVAQAVRIVGSLFRENGVVRKAGGDRFHDEIVHVQIGLSDDAAVGLIEDRQVRTLKGRQGRHGGSPHGVDSKRKFFGVVHWAGTEINS